MVSPNDLNPSTANKFKSLSLLRNDPKIHKVIEAGDTVFIALDQELIHKFHIQEGDLVYQVYDGTDNTIRLIFKDTKNRAAGSGYQTNPADNSADSGLDYQHEHE